MSSRYSPAMEREVEEESEKALDYASEMFTESLVLHLGGTSDDLNGADNSLRETLRASFRHQFAVAG